EQLQRLLQPVDPGALLGIARDRHRDRDACGRPPSRLQRHLPLRAGRLTAAMGARLRGTARGLAFGAGAGLVWAVVEAALAWWSGSVVPRPMAERLLAADVAFGATVGVATGLVAPGASRRLLALVLAGAYGLLRVYAPPGYGAEAFYVLVFALITAAVLRFVRRDATWTEVALTVALGALGVLLGDVWFDAHHETALRGMWLPLTV